VPRACGPQCTFCWAVDYHWSTVCVYCCHPCMDHCLCRWTSHCLTVWPSICLSAVMWRVTVTSYWDSMMNRWARLIDVFVEFHWNCWLMTYFSYHVFIKWFRCRLFVCWWMKGRWWWLCAVVRLYHYLFTDQMSQLPGKLIILGLREACQPAPEMLNHSGFYWSKRWWDGSASAGPYANDLHLAPDR